MSCLWFLRLYVCQRFIYQFTFCSFFCSSAAFVRHCFCNHSVESAPWSDSAPGQLGAHQFLHVLVVFADFVFVLDTLAGVGLADGSGHHAFLLGSDEHVSLRDGSHAVVSCRAAALVAVLTRRRCHRGWNCSSSVLSCTLIGWRRHSLEAQLGWCALAYFYCVRVFFVVLSPHCLFVSPFRSEHVDVFDSRGGDWLVIGIVWRSR